MASSRVAHHAHPPRLLQIKHERDALRGENAARRQQRGLVSSEELLIDFEKRRLALVAKKEEVEKLKARHGYLTQNIQEAKHQIQASGGVV